MQQFLVGADFRGCCITQNDISKRDVIIVNIKIHVNMYLFVQTKARFLQNDSLEWLAQRVIQKESCHRFRNSGEVQVIRVMQQTL